MHLVYNQENQCCMSSQKHPLVEAANLEVKAPSTGHH